MFFGLNFRSFCSLIWIICVFTGQLGTLYFKLFYTYRRHYWVTATMLKKVLCAASMASWAVGETPNLSPVELYISQTNHFSLIGLLIKSIQPLISGSRLILLIIMDTETTRAEWYIWSYTVQYGCLITRLSQAFHFKMPPVLERRRPSARLGFFLFIRRKPDKVVKVDMLCGLRGGGLHAEELPFSFTVGWEEGGEERRGRKGGHR